jgi:ATP-binding cassette, subfamily B, bacterial
MIRDEARAVQAVRLGWRVARQHPWRYALGMVLWATFWTLPAGVGLVLQAVFDALSGDAAVGLSVPVLLGALVAVEAARIGVFIPGVVVFTRWWMQIMAWLRHNMLRAQLANVRDEAGPPVADAGAAVPLFRDDVEDVLKFIDGWVDLAGMALFSTTALVVMWRVDAVITMVVVLPLLAVIGINHLLAQRIMHTRRTDREATARVTGFLGSAFSSVLAVKVAGAEERVVGELVRRNAHRSRTAVRDRVLTDAVEAFSSSTVELSVGLVLLLVAADMRTGDFTVGDLALFTAYLAELAGVPRWLGLVLARRRHAQVSFSRMGELMPTRDARAVVARRRLVLGPVTSARPRAPRPPAPEVALERLAVPGILEDVDLRLPAGSFTVVSGGVGSGKSTLLRAVLGLASSTEGTVRWDGHALRDVAAHMVPPRTGYVPQVPRLWSGTLEENLTLGVATPPALLADALHRAAFDRDVAAMPEGLATVVGARGVRLSGGQLQRAALARALVADPALLVLDDLSSALDAETERLVWTRLIDGGPPRTVLVVSHRAAALERADQIVLLEGGRVRAVGTWAALSERGLDPLAGAAPA